MRDDPPREIHVRWIAFHSNIMDFPFGLRSYLPVPAMDTATLFRARTPAVFKKLKFFYSENRYFSFESEACFKTSESKYTAIASADQRNWWIPRGKLSVAQLSVKLVAGVRIIWN
jgi:hypothetical protein